MAKKPLVDIALITYNHENFIAEAIDSVLMQQADFEFRLIIGDDCSTDKTQAIIKDYAQKYSERIETILYSKHMGICGKDRVGIEALSRCTAKYIAILDGDDYWTSAHKLQKQVDFLSANPDCTLCFHPVLWLDQESGKSHLSYYGAPRIDKFYNLDDLLEFSNFIPTASALYRADSIRKLPNWFYMIKFGDFGLAMISQLSDKLSRIGMIDEPMTVYRRHSGGMHGGHSLVFNQSRLIDTYQIIGSLANFRKRDSWKRGMWKWYIEYYNALLGEFVQKNPFSRKTIKNREALQCSVENLIRTGLNYGTSFDYFDYIHKPLDLHDLFLKVEKFLKNSNINNLTDYVYSASCNIPNIYASCYAVMIYSLLGKLNNIGTEEKNNWITYLDSFQKKEDGLFYDMTIYNDLYDTEDWWGAKHLAAHLISAYTSLNVKPKYQFEFLKPFYSKEHLLHLLENENWDGFSLHCNHLDNKIINIGILLQYQRDFFNDNKAATAVKFLLDYLESKINPATGLWGNFNRYDPDELSRAVQFGYHIYLLFFYDKRKIIYKEQLINNILSTQNIFGGFGGLLNSSACEDIDSIDLLVRLSKLTDYRNDDIKKSLCHALHWVLSNFNDDGGAVFRRNESFYYGHEQMQSKPNESSLFPTWLRLLSIAYIGKVLDVGYDLNIVNCAGYTFWHENHDEQEKNIEILYEKKTIHNISVIIPTLNRADYLLKALSSLLNQSIPLNSFEILVIDNGSTDSTRQVVEVFISANKSHSIRYIYEPEPGLLSGRHRGALEAKGDILVFTDDDIEATPNWLSSIASSFEDNDVHIVGGPTLPKFEIPLPEWMIPYCIFKQNSLTYCAYLSLQDLGDQKQEIDPSNVWGLNYAIRKETLFDLGGFHPDCIPKHLQHFQGDGETGLSMSIKELGYKALYHPSAMVYHLIPSSRLTVEYFESRFFYQGVCDSYTAIRKLGSADLILEQEYNPNDPIIPRHPVYNEIYQRIRKAYVDGYNFHLGMVKKFPKLLEWVTKKDYLDYKLPDLNI